MITNASCSTPTAGMEAILALKPLNIELKENAIASYLRMKQQKTWSKKEGDLAIPGHGTTIMKWAKEIPELEMPSDRLRRKTRNGNNFTTIIKERQKRSRLHHKRKDQTEVAAIIEASAKLIGLGTHNKTIKFMVDSQSAIKALINFTKRTA